MAAWGPTLRHVFLDLVNPKSSRSGVLLWMLHLLAGSENRRDMQMTHIVLLGDSIFDNSPYTAGGPDVISQVRQLLPVD
jgi:hypothetical protein